MVKHVSDAFVRNLSAAQRDLLIEHIDGDVPVSTAHQRLVRESLVRLGLLRGSTRHTIRPQHTALSEAGRMAVGKILGDCADALVRAGLLEQEQPIEALHRLRSLLAFPRPEKAAPEQPAP